MIPLNIPEAARVLVRHTPLIWCEPLSTWLKLESLQATGSFKLRGAALKLGRLDAAARGRGVVAASAGNHGMGVALAARAFGIAATIVVPRHAPFIKQRGIAQFGATVELWGEGYDEAEARAHELQSQSGALFVSAYDDEAIIDGNGRWLGVELAADLPSVSRVIVPVGGGGLSGGLADVLAPRGIEVVGVQPSANCAMYESLRLRRALTVYSGSPTLCEGLEGGVAERTFRLAAQLREIVLVEEDDVLRAIAFAYRQLGLVVEPSSAVVIAALRTGRVSGGPSCVAVISGGNIDSERLDQALSL